MESLTISDESPTTACTTNKKEYDAFIVYKTDADDKIARCIGTTLEEHSLKVLAHWKQEAFPAGQNIFNSIVRCVHNSARTVVILTKKSLESPWILLEMVQSIDQSQQSNTLTLRLVVNDVKDEDLDYLKRGILATVPHFRLNFSDANWKEMLVANIKQDVPLPDILPLEGSLAHGLVFSHYVGFLSHVLPVLKQTIEQTSIFRAHPQRVTRKYHILLPKTCDVNGSFESYDDQNKIRIKKEDIIEFKKSHVGKPRVFKLAIYEITKECETGDESYFFFADCPKILNAMFVMNTEGLKEIDMRHQLAQLKYILGEVINHAENSDCFGTVKLILYDENEGTMQSTLYDAVKESIDAELKEDTPVEDQSDTFENDLDVSEVDAKSDSSASRNTATNDHEVAINYMKDSTAECAVADELNKFFESRNISVYLDKGNERELSIRPAKWQIFLLSENTVATPNTLLYRCALMLRKGLMDNALRVIPVLNGIEVKDIPRYIKWVTVVSASEPKYCEKIYMTMKGGIVRMEHRLPSGDVAIGLAWAYVINYLVITLLGLDISNRIKEFLIKNKIDCGCLMKMFPVLPKSCTVEDRLLKKANEGVKDNDKVVKYLGMLEPVIKDTGGQLGRPFYLHVYKITDNVTQKSVCFIAEYFTPGHCLHGMAYSYPFAGLTTDEMLVQGKRTVELVTDILQLQSVKHKLGDMSNLVDIIYYDDDGQETLMSAICGHIFESKNRTRGTVYADGIETSIE